MKTLLINPPYPYTEGPIMPIGLSYLAGVLEHNGHEVQILDLLVSKYSKEKIKDKIEKYQPDIVGTTSVTMGYHLASDTLRYCKSLNKDIITIVGGPHVTFTARETLAEAPWIDIVVRGEGEMTMLDIVNGKKLADIDGIAYRDKSDGIKLNRERSLIEDLNVLPLPARHLFPLSRYHALNTSCTLVTSRGCPFNCIFCVGSRMGGRRIRYRDPKLVLDEIEHCLSLGFKEIATTDDLITINQKHLYAILDGIAERDLKFKWHAFSRVDTVNREMLQRMKQAGCVGILYGVESGNQQILDKIKKKITLEKIKEAVKMTLDAGIPVQNSFVLGLPGETKETLNQTIEFAISLNTFFGLHVLSPFPGTEIREKADEYGIEILTNDWSKHDCNRPITRTEGAGPEDIAAILYRYFMGLRLTPDALAGIKSKQEEIEKEKRRAPLEWAILQTDVIESLGRMELKGNPVETLTSKIAELVPYPSHQVKEKITKWVEDGLLKYDLRDGHVVWSWR
jgi:anaerobic magnesium-protoporphyrin IX monomethyl ester cyclase